MVRRLVVSFGGTFAILILLSGFVIYGLLAGRLKLERGLIVKDRLEAAASLLKSPVHGLVELKHRIESEWPLRDGEKVFVVVLDGDRHVVIASPHIPAKIFGALTSADRPVGNESGGELLEVMDDGGKYLSRGSQVENSVGLKNPLFVRAAIGERQSRDFLSTLRQIMAVVFLLNLFLSAFLGWQLVRRQMNPLRSIAEKVGQIDSENLHEKIAEVGLPIELLTLAKAFNRTFDRLADSFTRLSGFSSDLAHELRTPISNIVGSIEVTLARPRNADEYREVLSSTLEETGRLRQITDTLLFLARAENPQERLSLTAVNLRAETESLVDFYEALASERAIQISLAPSVPPELISRIEPVLFQRAVANLLSNAIRATPQDGKIEIDFGRDEGGDWLKISDTGDGIAARDLPLIFQRFYRIDPSRNPRSGGTGLGLAIVKSIMDLHQGQVLVKSEIGAGSEFTLRWPAPPEIKKVNV